MCFQFQGIFEIEVFYKLLKYYIILKISFIVHFIDNKDFWLMSILYNSNTNLTNIMFITLTKVSTYKNFEFIINNTQIIRPVTLVFPKKPYAIIFTVLAFPFDLSILFLLELLVPISYLTNWQNLRIVVPSSAFVQ